MCRSQSTNLCILCWLRIEVSSGRGMWLGDGALAMLWRRGDIRPFKVMGLNCTLICAVVSSLGKCFLAKGFCVWAVWKWRA